MRVLKQEEMKQVSGGTFCFRFKCRKPKTCTPKPTTPPGQQDPGATPTPTASCSSNYSCKPKFRC